MPTGSVTESEPATANSATASAGATGPGENHRHHAVPRPRSGIRRKILMGVGGLAVAVALVWGFQRWSYGRVHESTENAQVDGQVVPILARVGGYVTAVEVDDNQRVAAGSPLVRIDDAEYRVRLAEADAQLTAARATAGSGDIVGQAQAAVAAAAGQASVYAAQEGAARANLTRTRTDLERMRELAAKEIVSRQQLDAAQAAAAAAAANLLAIQNQRGAAGATVQSARAGTRLADARLDAALAARSDAALQLSYTSISAPIAGLVSRRQVEPGQLVQPGQPLLSIVADSGLWVTANFKETQLEGIRVGQSVELDVDAYPGCVAHGRVESLSAATGARFALLPPDNATGNFTKVVQRVPVRIQLTDGCGDELPLRPGMSVEAHVRTAQ